MVGLPVRIAVWIAEHIFFLQANRAAAKYGTAKRIQTKKHQIMKAGVWRVRAKNLGGNSQRFCFPGGIHSEVDATLRVGCVLHVPVFFSCNILCLTVCESTFFVGVSWLHFSFGQAHLKSAFFFFFGFCGPLLELCGAAQTKAEH